MEIPNQVWDDDTWKNKVNSHRRVETWINYVEFDLDKYNKNCMRSQIKFGMTEEIVKTSKIR